MFLSFLRRSKSSVLLVSEGAADSLLEGEFLRHPDLRLLTAAPNRETLEIVRRERPGLIIEELDPPGDLGLEFCHELESDARTRSIPLILVINEHLRGRAQETQADCVIEKPLAARTLYDAVRLFIRLPHRRRERVTINLRFQYRYGGRTGQGFSRDLSSHGVFLKTDRPFPLGSTIELRFSLPGSEEERRCQGVVRSTCRAGHGSGTSGVGLEFVGLSPQDQQALESFLEQPPTEGAGLGG